MNRNTEAMSTSGRIGYFENLVQYISLGFEIVNCEVEKILKNTKKEESMFFFRE